MTKPARLKGPDLIHYDYLLIGGGMTADAAARGIRDVDETGSIGLISAETDPPYSRPPLSKGLWRDQQIEDTDRETASLGVNLHLGRRASALDRAARTVTDDHGQLYGYRRLLLATGGQPRRLRGLDDGVIYYRTLADYRHLRQLTRQPRSVLVLGGGYIGAELAAALSGHGHKLHMAFPEVNVLERLLPVALARTVSDRFSEQGVVLHRRLSAESVRRSAAGTVARFDDGTELLVDVVVAGLGIIPDTALAAGAGLAVQDGIIVNEFLQTADPAIFAAGDVASIYSPALGVRRRVEHEENANYSGLFAGRAMAGEAEAYTHLPMFYSDVFDFAFEGVGLVDSRLQTEVHWDEPLESGSIHYLQDGLVRGVLMWNSHGRLDEARSLISAPGSTHG